MEGITIKIQKGIGIYTGMASVADAVARGKRRYENDKTIVICEKNTYRVLKRRQLNKRMKADCL